MQKGKLLVITGLSGSGKDAVIECLIEKNHEFCRLVTCTDRPPRPGEINGTHYYFCTSEELDLMYKNKELVEKPLNYGESRKATPKKEFKKLEEGMSLIWRIEASLAAQVASGKFFDEWFGKNEKGKLSESTVIAFITADKKEVEARRRARDGKNYNPEDYKIRDEQDALIMKKYGHLFENIIENKEGELDKTVDKIVKLLA